jgi:hypothetical protein
METEKFESMLKSGEDLAERFRDHADATDNLEAARQHLQEAQQAVESAAARQKQTGKLYEDAKVALIGSVEAL